jgi:hypothetical protein
MANIYDWSTTPGSNASASPYGWPEGMPPSGVNDSARQMMAETAKWRDLISGAKTTAGTDTITLTSGATITSYTGLMFVAKLGGTNTGAATINIDSVGAVAVEIDGAAVGAGDLVSGKYYTFVYDGVAFQASRLSAADVAAASETVAGVVELATAAEVVTGTDTARAVTPAGASAQYSPITRNTNDDTTTALTAALTDAGDIVFMNNASANVFTIPTNATVAFAVGDQIDVVMEGVGVTSVTAASGVTLNGVSAGTAVLNGQYMAVTLVKRATDTWIMFGAHAVVA